MKTPAEIFEIDRKIENGRAALEAFAETEPPHKSTQNGAVLLDETRAFIRRFCCFPGEHELTAVTLWAAHAHMVEHLHVSPRLAFLSPEPSSGKSRALEILDLLSPNAMLTINASPAAIFRTLSDRQITLLFDEVDTIWAKRGKDDGHEDLRGLLNAGYRRGASIPRCVGPQHDVRQFPVYCAVALAGLGSLPDTIMSRSAIVRMRRRAPHETVEPYRIRVHEPEGHALRDRLASWAEAVGASVGESWPVMPAGIVDRPGEIWEPLIAVADAAGGSWPEAARAACVALCASAEDRRASLGVRLLGDLRTIFAGAEKLATSTILERLHDGARYGLGDDHPWADLRGRPVNERDLANLLKAYGVKAQKIWVDTRALQGYSHQSLHDAWQRYLPSLTAQVGGAEGTEEPAPMLAENLPAIPHLPRARGAEGDAVCRRCGGEGCGYCHAKRGKTL